MTSGMEVVEVLGNVFHPSQVVGHGFRRKFSQGGVGGTGVQGIGRVCHDGRNIVLFSQLKEGLYIFFIDRLSRSSSRVACKKLKGVGSDAHSIPAHGQKSFGGR